MCIGNNDTDIRILNTVWLSKLFIYKALKIFVKNGELGTKVARYKYR